MLRPFGPGVAKLLLLKDFFLLPLIYESKSAVSRPWKRKFLGSSFTNGKNPKRRISTEARRRFKKRIRELTRRARGISQKRMIEELSSYLRGWNNYYSYCQTPSILEGLEKWIRRRLRSVASKQWATQINRLKELKRLGVVGRIATKTAGSSKGPWRISKSQALGFALSKAYFTSMGLQGLSTR